MARPSFEIGDEVVLISDDSITYVILSIYGNGYAICRYFDERMNKLNELSVPLVALMKANKMTVKQGC